MKRIESDPAQWRARLLFTMVFSLACWLVLGLNLVRLLGSWTPPYIAANLPFFAMAAGLLLSLRFILHTDLSTIMTDHRRIRQKPLWLGFGAYLATHLLFLLATAMADPGLIIYNPVPLATRIPFIVAALIITPIQTTSEELLFRILPVRFIQGSSLKPSALVSLVSAALFTLPHLSNQEVTQGSNRTIVLLYYAIFAATITYLSLRNGGFEVAVGVHAANNLFVAIFANYSNSSLPSHSLFFSQRLPGSAADLVQLIISLAVVALVTGREREASECKGDAS